MPEIKQIERVIRILQRLYVSRNITVNSLYQYFDGRVPKRTLQRDLVEISMADIPLSCEKPHGQEQVWSVDRGFLRFIPQTIDNQEVLASFFLERLASLTRGTRLERDIQSLLSKARQLTGPNVFHSSDGDFPQDMFGATFMGYVDYSQHSEKIDRIIGAASQCRSCRFRYRRLSADADSEFDANPYLLLYHKGALYVVAYVEEHDNYIFLPVQRIRDVAVSDRTFTRDQSFSLEKLREGRFGIYGGPELKPERVRLQFSSDIADVIEERIWHPSQQIERKADGSVVLTLQTVVSDELRAWVGSWLDYATVIEPKDLLARKKERA